MTLHYLVGISSAVELSTVNRVVLGSNPRYPANKVIVPRVVVATSGLKKSKVTDGCVTPWVIMINNDTSRPKFAK